MIHWRASLSTGTNLVGLTAFAAGLKSNKGLRTLWLGGNSIDEVGAVVMADAFNTSLTKLWLDSNSIGEGGAVALGEALKVNTSLAGLHLEFNNFGSEGAAA
jgi:Ran GTPase-activating protein (RanGAP) involved in mRNA processing and transport